MGRTRGIRSAGRRWTVAGTFVCLGLLGGCGFAPQPPPTPLADAAAPPKRVMFIGDSLLVEAEPMIANELVAHHMPTIVLNRAVGGWGLLTRLYGPGTDSRPADLIKSWIETDKPDVVVVEFSGNYWPGQDGPDDYLSLGWSYRWNAEAERFTQAVLATGTRLYWVVPPPRSSIESTWFGFRDLSIIEAYAHPGVKLVDWWTPMTTEDGHWAIWIDTRDGHGYSPIRNRDGLHFTPEGAQRMAEWTVFGIRSEWDPPATTSVNGP